MRTPSFRTLSPLAAILAAGLGLGGCDWNEVETGHAGVLEFTPVDCGPVGGCDLDDGIAVGATVLIEVDGVDLDTDAEDVSLYTSDPYVLDVSLVERGAFTSTWLVEAVGEGYAELIAYDRGGYEIDVLELEARWSDALVLEPREGDAVGPVSDSRYDEIWAVNAGERVAFRVRPYRGAGPLMGDLVYDVVIDAGLADAMLPGADVGRGYLLFEARAGTYEVVFDDGGVVRRVLFEVR